MRKKEERANVQEVTPEEWVTKVLSKPTTRRTFLKVAGAGSLGTLAFLTGCTTKTTKKREVYISNAKFMILADPTRCVGCRRCEIACTSFNEGKNQPSLARIKINRNYLFGPKGVQVGFWNGEGIYGNHRIVQDTCRQCPHPVPCLDACPYGAIEVNADTGARVVNQQKCKGCRTCQGACPWAMTVFDEEIKKASKCHLCNGDPQCVKACPTGALKYVPWTDRTKEIPTRFAPVVELPAEVAAACKDCH